jgi:RluA family pseudouridine synthase
MGSIVNIAAYKFTELTGLVELRNQLREIARSQHLRGTILLSAEGINLFVAGERGGIDQLLDHVRQVPGLADLPVKESFSDYLPFTRMLVKIKREIIAFGVDAIDPRRYTSRRLSAPELKRWLDEGRPITLLDTRNDFEVQTGTFRTAIRIGIEDFRDFPRAVDRLPQQMKRQPVVTFCTGGIRCEKAAPYLEQAGFTEVYQLDGGILKYFEQCGGAHYQGQCFVFDQRVALDPQLNQTNLRQCFACQAILSPEDQASPRYDPPRTCPHCFQTPEEKYRLLLERRQQAIAAATAILPGSVPYDNVRPISVPLRFDGLELLDFLDAMRTHLSREQWGKACEEKRLVWRGEAVSPGRIVHAGERFLHLLPATLEPDVATDIRILFEDDAIVVVSKPAPLPMHPCGRFNRNSLSYLLDQVYHPRHLRAAHRLDADTSGVVVFSKSREIASLVQPQFEAGQIQKQYLARVHGHPSANVFDCDLAISPDPGCGGIRLPNETGDRASTRFQLAEKFDDGTSLLRVMPLTGRTNQIRVHLWALGLPIVGDPIYLRDAKLGGNQALSVSDPPMCLHAAEIEFTHPTTQQRVRFAADAPGWTHRNRAEPEQNNLAQLGATARAYRS